MSPQDALRMKLQKQKKCLAEYIALKQAPRRARRDVDDIDVADVISIHVDDKNLEISDGASKLFARLARLNEYWAQKSLPR